MISRAPAYPDAYLLLANIYEKQGKRDEAAQVYRRALAAQAISERDKAHIKSQLYGVSGLQSSPAEKSGR